MQRRRCPTPVLLLAALSCWCVQGFIALKPTPVSLPRWTAYASETLEQEAPTQALEDHDGAY